MAVSQITDHLSFRPATEIIREWEQMPASLPGCPAALSALAEAKASIRPPVVPDVRKRLLTAQAWGVSPRGARRNVLRAAGLNPQRWENPIHSFTDAERIALRAAASSAIRMYERMLNAI
jgi:hypothetical protein